MDTGAPGPFSPSFGAPLAARMALRNSWCFSRHLDLFLGGWLLLLSPFPRPAAVGDTSRPSTRCFVESKVLRFLVDSFSHTLLWRSRACGLKVRLQMVHGRSVEGPSSGNSGGSSGGG